jgi:rhodanese-related sulfurtransferase
VRHQALAIVALALGAAAAIARSPFRAPSGGSALDVRSLASAVQHEADHVTATELGAWIKARKPGLRVIDVRSQQEFDEDHIPTAERLPLETLVNTRFDRDDTLVLYSGGGAHAAQGWVFLRALGYEHVYFLRGGFDEWNEEVMNPVTPTDVSRYFGGSVRSTAPPGHLPTKRRIGC